MYADPHHTPHIKTILLVEDDLDDQEFITQAFLHIDKHLRIHKVFNGNKVLPYLQNLTDSELPQLIVLDYNLPERDGSEVLQALAQYERYQAIPKIVWSTSNSPQSFGRCMELGAASYLVKPYDIAGIENLARQMLEFCPATVLD
jgi:CheY-like chemotaxis protein